MVRIESSEEEQATGQGDGVQAAYPRYAQPAALSTFKPVFPPLGRLLGSVVLGILALVLAVPGLFLTLVIFGVIFGGEFDHDGWLLVGQAALLLAAATLPGWLSIRLFRGNR